VPGDKRKTYIVNIALADKVDKIAFLDDTPVKNVVNTAFKNHIAGWEKQNGDLDKITKKK